MSGRPAGGNPLASSPCGLLVRGPPGGRRVVAVPAGRAGPFSSPLRGSSGPASARPSLMASVPLPRGGRTPRYPPLQNRKE